MKDNAVCRSTKVRGGGLDVAKFKLYGEDPRTEKPRQNLVLTTSLSPSFLLQISPEAAGFSTLQLAQTTAAMLRGLSFWKRTAC